MREGNKSSHHPLLSKSRPISSESFFPGNNYFLLVPFVLMNMVAFHLPQLSLWLSLGVALDFVKIVSFTPSLRISLGSMKSFNTIRNLYVFWLKPNKIFIFNLIALIRNLAPFGSDIQSLIKFCFLPSPLSKMHSEEKKTFSQVYRWVCQSFDII